MKRYSFKRDEAGFLILGTGIDHGKMIPLDFKACGTISSGVVANCSTKPVAGVETTIYLANRTDIASLTYNVSNSLIVENITMTATKLFYKFTGIKQSNTPSFRMNKTKFINNWIHSLEFLVFANDGATKKILNDLADSDVVAIIENKWKGTSGSMAFELLGYSVGLVLTAGERNPNDAETAGAWKLTLGPDEGQFEDNPPLTVFDTDYATTKALVEGLTV